jgi:hypothetical protein
MVLLTGYDPFSEKERINALDNPTRTETPF